MTNHSITRRDMLRASAASLGGIALTGLPRSFASAATGPLAPQPTHHAARAKRVVFLFMHGGPSHVDTFDYKPRLQIDNGKELPFKAADNISAIPKLLKSPWKFARHGECGNWVSELLPNIAKHIDDLCVIRSMHSRGQSHGQAVSMLHTGTDNLVMPSVGAWVSYGLGTENADLPSFLSISPASGHGGPRNYGCAFLPAIHQATTIGNSGKLGDAKIQHLGNERISEAEQRQQLELLQAINREQAERAPRDANLTGAIESLDLAFRMQTAAPEVLDLSRESKPMQELYGIGTKQTDNFGRQCLLARRLAEAGVRYVEVSTGNVWDQHSNLKNGHEKNSLATDQPVAALLTDLKARGMLEDTLVVWGGEFGRTPIVQGSNGRDHSPQGFTVWLAGGGVRGGLAHGNTDEYGYYAAEDRVHMHDLHATMLHLLGMNHERLTYRYAGRDFRLTDIYGKTVREIIA
ncbi:MAG: sulfatase [Planctomycetaceae bacterium]|nr:sulfatase [Planctomycetaceae bacterium]